MNFKNIFKGVRIFAFSFFILTAYSGYSQEQQNPEQVTTSQYSEDELEKFVSLAQQVIPIELAAQESMVKEVESQGLSVERFNEIATMKEMGMEGQVEDKELQSFEQATAKVNTIVEEAESEIKNTLEEGGMSLEKFQEIITAYQEDPEVRDRVNDKMSM